VGFRFESRNGVEVLVPEGLDGLDGLRAVFTTRHGGVSQGPYTSLNLGLHVDDHHEFVVENRRRACAAAGVALDDLVVAVQSHGPNVAIVDATFRGRGARTNDDAVPNADVLVTNTPGVALMIMVADCVPIICWDPVARVVSAIHAGWRGTVTRAAEAAVNAMSTMGSNPADIVAAIGPAIAPKRYQVGPEVAEQASDGLGEELAATVIGPDGTGRYLFDLWAANVALLAEAGVPPANIATARIDSGSDKFFSDRLARPCGRFAAIASIPAR